MMKNDLPVYLANNDVRVQTAAEAYAAEPTQENWVKLEIVLKIVDRELICE